LVTENLDNAARQFAQGHPEEAAEIYHAVLVADPHNAKATAGLEEIGPYTTVLVRPSALGVNLCRRRPGGSTALRICTYPVNRVLDLLDVISFHVGLEGGVYVDAHATRAVSTELGAGGGMHLLGWWPRRELGLGAGHVAGVAVGPFEAQGEGFTRLGTRGARTRSFSVVDMNTPLDYPYQVYRDYWGIGVRLIAVLVGVEVEIHPVELADGITGFLYLDFLRDDIGHTRGWRFTGADKEAMADLLNTLSPAELRAAMRGRSLPPPATAPADSSTAPRAE
jgi:hypothetical protein